MADGPLQFLVDTGAQVSVLPPEQLPAGAKVDCDVVPQLAAANGSTIRTAGHTDHVVTLMGRRFPWRFLVAEVGMPILGADFLAHHGLTVNMSELALCDSSVCVCVCMVQQHLQRSWASELCQWSQLSPACGRSLML